MRRPRVPTIETGSRRESPITPKEPEAAVTEKTEQTLREVEQEYTQGADFPLRSYAGAMGVYTGMVAALAGLAKATRRPIPSP